MKGSQTLLLFVFSALISTLAIGAKYPRGCEVKGFGYNENYLIMNEKGEQTFYLIQNQSNHPIELRRHETRDVFMSPTLQVKINPGKWAAFASDVENLHFNCYALKGDNTSLINCSDVLDVCQYPRVKFALSNMGNYWVSTNKSQNRVIKESIAKGILLRW